MNSSPSNNVNTPRKLRMAIIGGGIGGLTLAAAIGAKCNSPSADIEQLLSVDIYESAAKIMEIGAGVSVWPRTWKILKDIGLEADLKELLTEKERFDPEGDRLAFSFRKSDQENGFTFHQVHMEGGATFLHRQDVQQTLLAHVPPFFRIHLSHRLTHCTETNQGVDVHFQNGVSASYDIVVGADGIHSATRNSMSQLHSDNNTNLYTKDDEYNTGTVAYRGLIAKDKLQQAWPGHRVIEEPVIYCGKSRHIVVYPIRKGQVINVVAFVSHVEDKGRPLDGPRVRDATIEEMVEAYKGWEPEVIRMLECMDKPTRWVIRELRPLDTYISPQYRIALLGDASHAMTPHLGVGAGTAIEDAYILGGIIARALLLVAHSSEQNQLNVDQVIPRVFEVYNQIRQPFGNQVVTRARNQGLYYEFNAEEFVDLSKTGTGEVMSTEDASWIPIVQRKITDNWSWVWENPTAEYELHNAEEMLKV